MNIGTGYTPYKLVFGKQVNLPIDLGKVEVTASYNLDEYSELLKYKLQTAHARAHGLQLKEKARRKSQYDARIAPQDNFQIGDKVTLRKMGQTKLQPLRYGQFTIKEIENSNALIEDIHGKIRKIHKNMIVKMT